MLGFAGIYEKREQWPEARRAALDVPCSGLVIVSSVNDMNMMKMIFMK